uniref:DENN domain-containing protein 1B-like n=1 Tax=Poecilia formosa TaxID=48698 RepID=A0A096M4C8_POEFO
MSVGPRDLGYGLDDDELDTASKISSEDSGEVRSYTEDSDDSDSFYPDIDPSPSSQMNLLEEILDSLTTTTTDQGKLSAAKSLDFFRSLDDLDDYKVQSKPSPCSHSAAADDSSFDGGADHGGWNMGQDDSAVHGKHLPPSPRRQPNKSSLKRSGNLAAFSAVTPCSASPPSLDANGTNMSKEMVKNFHERSVRRQRSRGNHDSQTSPTKSSQVQVPWKCEGSETAGGPDPGLLEEIESMCCLSSSLHSSLHLSQVHCSNSHHQVQG